MNIIDEQYFRHLRPEIIGMIPDSARHVLDVGCGAGVLGRYLKDRGVETVWGVELADSAAAEAAKVLDRVFHGNAETVQLPAGVKFDCIVCADVLEHLADPWRMVDRLKAHLAEGGCIVASIPNVGYYKVVRDLIKGRWEYTDAGILDRTHLRFFTLDGALALFSDNGMVIDDVYRVIHAKFLMKCINALVMNAISESLVYQYVIRTSLKKQRGV